MTRETLFKTVLVLTILIAGYFAWQWRVEREKMVVSEFTLTSTKTGEKMTRRMIYICERIGLGDPCEGFDQEMMNMAGKFNISSIKYNDKIDVLDTAYMRESKHVEGLWFADMFIAGDEKTFANNVVRITNKYGVSQFSVINPTDP